MKPFDLEAAKRGEPIVTRDGRKAEFVAHIPKCASAFRVIALIDKFEVCSSFHESGKHLTHSEHCTDLFMAPKKKKIYFGVCKNKSNSELYVQTFRNEEKRKEWVDFLDSYLLLDTFEKEYEV